ncbi:RNA polymerase sigma factor [Blastomonas sp. UPD001]|uniref:RNA polymerase sigma factor n=1 Tax=Blastomonas sp. UPD001 TaxID=2217673 RepID=UPI0013004E89|nr:RNA polymerase sigma factor [Blastomonas sp. UPD001]
MTAASLDAALVRAARAGDPGAQRALVERYRETVYRLARSATGDPDEALDITQEAFIAVFGALNRFDPERSFKAWISAITLNKCRDWARRRAVRRFMGLPMPEQAADWIADEAPSAETLVADRAELAATVRAIAELPTGLKDVLILCTVEGLSQQETATTLGLSVKAVETRLGRARKKLQETLRGEGLARV